MTFRSRREAARAALGALAGIALCLGGVAAQAQSGAGGQGAGLQGLNPSTLGSGNQPIHIEAESGIEWQQSNHLYIARGKAWASRGQASVHADTLYAFYRQAAPKAPAPAAASPAGNKPPAGAETLMNGGATEIYRFEAVGNVRFADGDQTAYGDHAVYDIDQAVLVLTGGNLRVETKNETVTARNSLEWYDKKQIAVARGDAVATRAGKSIRGDTLVAEVEKPDNQSSRIRRIDAYGDVIVADADQVAHGDQGVYNVDTGIATLTGDVDVTKGNDVVRGRYAVVDTNANVSRILGANPGMTAAAAGSGPVSGGPRVAGLLIPDQKPGASAPAVPLEP
jgi:lipopolysaccharide export system protein LptA